MGLTALPAGECCGERRRTAGAPAKLSVQLTLGDAQGHAGSAFSCRNEGCWPFPGRQCGGGDMLLRALTCSFGAGARRQGHHGETWGNPFRSLRQEEKVFLLLKRKALVNFSHLPSSGSRSQEPVLQRWCGTTKRTGEPVGRAELNAPAAVRGGRGGSLSSLSAQH